MKSSQPKNITPANSNHSPFFQKERSNNLFGKGNKPFFNSTSIQAKLTVNQPNDPYEKEDDAMADKAIQVFTNSSFTNSENNSTPFFNKPNQSVQRKCTACEKEGELQKKSETTSTQPASAFVASNLNSSKGSGSALPHNTRQHMEYSFGSDFSNIRLHTDSSAVQMNKNLHAQAFTHGSDIYFNAGKYDTNTSGGKHLLAHELTHVVQQGGGAQSVQRVPDDRHDLTAVSLSGDPTLEKCFDNELVIGMFSNSRGTHVGKIQEALIQLGIPLPTFGADEKYGTETANGVKDFQQKAGMTGPKEWDGIAGRKTIGLLDQSLRNNNIEKDTDDSKEDFKVFDEKKKEQDEACKGKATDKPCPDPNTDVDTAADEAIKMIDKVLREQLPPVKNTEADYPSIFERIFRKNDTRNLSEKVVEVKAIFEQIKDFIGKLQTDKKLTRCGTDCDGGCRSGSPAYHTPTKEGGHIITFCPDFNKDKDRILIVIHESHHAVIPGSRDKAYAETRLFDKLDHKTALLNAASFHVYAAWVDKPGSQPIGPEVKDTNLINDPKQKEITDLALAHMNQWFRLVPFDTSQTVQGVEEANLTGTYRQNNPRVFMELVFSKWFGLTPPPARPTSVDVQKIKAIDERMNTMEDVFKKPFVIVETPNASFWERGPGTGIALNQNSLKLDIHHLIIALLQELVHAVPNISAESEPLYVGTINDMRNLRDLDPK